MPTRRSRSVCYVAIAVSLICCGQLSLLVWIDSKSVISRELLNNHLIMPANGIDPLKNFSVHPTYKSISEKASPQNVESTRTDSTNTETTSTTTTTTTTTTTAAAATDSIRVREIKNLYDSDLILGHGVKLKWIRNRMMAMASTWDKAAQNLSAYKPVLFQKQKNILLLPGLLVDKLCPKCKFAENALKGGPVGELVQWTDLIVSLFMLGHNITIVTTQAKLDAVRGEHYDVIFSDYIGLLGLQRNGILPQYYCRVRVLDTFGSEPLEIFNATDYMPEDTYPYFRRWNFQNTKQFWNLYPHTPDNSFLGFAMETPEQVHNEKRKDMALIYGKKDNYMVGRENYVAAIGEKLQLHSTFKYLRRKIPNRHITNHGIVDHATLSGLLQSSKLFIGLGFPYEGPGPLQSLANGCPYIQPKFIPPRGRKNEKFFKQKPTTRILTSQSPYLEDYVGEPYVFTVDATNMSEVNEVVDKVIKRGDLPPYIPYEFTPQGMMERVGAYITYQDFCRGNILTVAVTSASSELLPDHMAVHAIDDDPEGETCYYSNMSPQSWWEADLGSERFVREIDIQFKNISMAHLNSTSMVLSLRDSAGFNRTHEPTINNGNSLYSWTNIETMARYVRIDSRSSVPHQLMLCKVDIYGTSTVWPKPSLMKVLPSEDNESCNAVCAKHHLLCEHSYFPLVNSFKALSKNFNCESMKETTENMNVFPSYILSDDKEHGFVTGTCVTTRINPLLSCSGGRQGYLRLCPCRQYRKGQVALPIEL